MELRKNSNYINNASQVGQMSIWYDMESSGYTVLVHDIFYMNTLKSLWISPDIRFGRNNNMYTRLLIIPAIRFGCMIYYINILTIVQLKLPCQGVDVPLLITGCWCLCKQTRPEIRTSPVFEWPEVVRMLNG